MNSSSISEAEANLRPNFLTVNQACSELNLGRSKLYQLIRSKRLAVIRYGSRSTRIPRVAIERLVEELQAENA